MWYAALKLCGWGLLLLYFPIMMIFVHAELNDVRCTHIVTNVHTKGANVLITDNDLKNTVNRCYKGLIGTKLSEISYDSLEHLIERSAVVKKCQAYPTIDGAVHVEISQREPIMRVFAQRGSYYMDAEGGQITANDNMRTHCLVVNGNVNSMPNNDELIRLCLFIDSDPFWKAMIEQVHVTRNHEFILVPRVGNHVVELGTTDNMEQKFADLLTLYKKGWEKKEWNVYKSVSLKYNGQIVCTKR